MKVSSSKSKNIQTNLNSEMKPRRKIPYSWWRALKCLFGDVTRSFGVLLYYIWFPSSKQKEIKRSSTRSRAAGENENFFKGSCFSEMFFWIDMSDSDESKFM